MLLSGLRWCVAVRQRMDSAQQVGWFILSPRIRQRSFSMVILRQVCVFPLSTLMILYAGKRRTVFPVQGIMLIIYYPEHMVRAVVFLIPVVIVLHRIQSGFRVVWPIPTTTISSANSGITLIIIVNVYR